MTLNQAKIKTQIENDYSSDSDAENSDDELSNSEKESENEMADDESRKESGDGENTDYFSNAGWVDSIAKILKTKAPKGKKSLVLSKAKKIADVVKQEKPKELSFQIEGEIKTESEDTKPDISALEKEVSKRRDQTDEPPRKKRRDIENIRLKPNILDKDRERALSKIATRGVVQLFNAVRNQQKDIENKLDEAGPLERKRENVMKNIDKRSFLDMLMKKKSERVDNEVKNEPEDKNKSSKHENESTWNVLRDDFMMGAKLKDWDKQLEDDENETQNAEDMSDSD